MEPVAMHWETSLIQCDGCGARVPDIEGPQHRYIGASPGCWQLFGELQVRGTHRLAVDTYAAQHPGVPGKQSSQSVAAHLFVLCIVLEQGVDPGYATQAITQFLRRRKAGGFAWMEPPPSLGPVTVLDVLGAAGAKEHNLQVMRWAESVWSAWEPHHATVRAWAAEWANDSK